MFKTFPIRKIPIGYGRKITLFIPIINIKINNYFHFITSVFIFTLFSFIQFIL